MLHMRRREFITLLGGAAVAWPLAARAQQPAVPVIGYLSARSRDDTSHLIAAFQHGLAESGFVEGRNVSFEYHFAIGQYDRLPAMATELVRRSVAVIAATGGEPSVQAAKAATSTIPIVFATGVDPVKQGLVASFNRPGGNITGIVLFANQLEPKRLGLLRDLAPQASTVGILLNPSFAASERQLRRAMSHGARSLYVAQSPARCAILSLQSTGGTGSETSRVHHTARRCGHRLANSKADPRQQPKAGRGRNP
jgi:putative ABC transport system substrate-binding protein